MPEGGLIVLLLWVRALCSLLSSTLYMSLLTRSSRPVTQVLLWNKLPVQSSSIGHFKAYSVQIKTDGVKG